MNPTRVRPQPLLALVAVLLASPLASAADGDVILTGARKPIGAVKGVPGKEVVLYGPVDLTPALRGAKEYVSIHVDGVEYGGNVSSAQLYVVDPSKKRAGVLRIDPTDYVGSFATMADGHAEPTTFDRSIHDYEVQGAPFRPFTHLRAMRRVMIAIVIDQGDMKFGKMVLSAH